MKWKPVQVDGLLWSVIGGLTFSQACLSTDEAWKYCNPYLLFWLKFTIGTLNAALLGLKMFRSTSYAKHLDDKKAGLEGPVPDPYADLR